MRQRHRSVLSCPGLRLILIPSGANLLLDLRLVRYIQSVFISQYKQDVTSHMSTLGLVQCMPGGSSGQCWPMKVYLWLPEVEDADQLGMPLQIYHS